MLFIVGAWGPVGQTLDMPAFDESLLDSVQ